MKKWLLVALAARPAAASVEVKGRQMLLDGKPFEVRGVCYSPTPVNESVYFVPHGDYFTSDYSFIWQRDLPLIKAMGANMLRVYGWLPQNDHSDFLDAVHANGLKAMATFYMGDATESPVGTASQRDDLIGKFKRQVAQYADKPALIIWSFGNELNGVWNGYLQQLGRDPSAPCAWDDRYDDLGGCWIHKGKAPLPGDVCYNSSYCVYSRLFTLIEESAQAAKSVADVLVVSAFADVDALYDKVARAGHLAPTLDAWTAQVYRGDSFGDFFIGMSNSTDKPVLLTEYGVDAYHDACGMNDQSPCFNFDGDNSGSRVDEEAQAAFALNLTLEIRNQSSIYSHCSSAKRGAQNCTTVGGFLMSWVDEYWKGAKSQTACDPTYDDPKFSVSTCDHKAHVTCGNWDASVHDLCGYPLDAAPDHYVNEEWFGITAPDCCGDSVNALAPRHVFWQMRQLWLGKGENKTLFAGCHHMLAAQCGSDDAEKTGWLVGLIGLIMPAQANSLCSGRGECVTDWKKCGPGTVNVTSTPCCTCDVGFAGRSCNQLDARLYLALAGGAALLLLLLLLCAAKLVSACFARPPETGVSQPLLPGKLARA